MAPARYGRGRRGDASLLRRQCCGLATGLLAALLATGASAETRFVSALPSADGSGWMIEYEGGDGARLPVEADDTSLLMARLHGSEVALVSVNMAGEVRQLEVPAALPGDGSEALIGKSVPVTAEGSGAVWDVPPLSVGIVLAR